ncbi:potassium channel family protein [Kitasatospora sp. NPDC054939]
MDVDHPPPPPRDAPDLRVWGQFVGVFGLLMVGYFTVPLRWFGDHRPVFSWIAFGIAIALLTLLLLMRIRDVLMGAGRHPGIWLALLICLSLVLFATSYYVLAGHPGDFDGLETRLDALYFTVVTMSTIGYGDITAASQSARLVVVLQVVYNFVFLAAAAGTLSGQVRSGLESRLHRQAGPGRAGRDRDRGPDPGAGP